MRARGWCVVAAVMLWTSAAADPKPKPVEIKPFRDRLFVLTDVEGGIYVVLPGHRDSRVFYGTGGKRKQVYEQVVVGRSQNGDAWEISVWAPRVPNIQPGSIQRRADGSYVRWCGSDQQLTLSVLPADKAKAVIDKSTFLTSAMTRKPYLLARDDAGVYYYVDTLRQEYGGKGFRVFIGRKGAMKQRPLTDITNDSAGDVFATKTGDLRIVRDATGASSAITWIKGQKRAPLVSLDIDASSVLIYKDLGVYGFTGSICENL